MMYICLSTVLNSTFIKNIWFKWWLKGYRSQLVIRGSMDQFPRAADSIFLIAFPKVPLSRAKQNSNCSSEPVRLWLNWGASRFKCDPPDWNSYQVSHLSGPNISWNQNKTFGQPSVFAPVGVILIHINNCAGKISHRCLCKPVSSF